MTINNDRKIAFFTVIKNFKFQQMKISQRIIVSLKNEGLIIIALRVVTQTKNQLRKISDKNTPEWRRLRFITRLRY